MKLFGFTINRNKEFEERQKNLTSVVVSTDTEGGVIVQHPFSAIGYNLNFDATSETELINKYRELSLVAEVEAAIDEIVNDSICVDGFGPPVTLNLDKLPFSTEVKKIITREFETILELLNFNESAYEIFRRWYIDGRIYYNIIIDTKRPEDGIIELRYIDPRKLKRVKEVKDQVMKAGMLIPTSFEDYFIYSSDNYTAKIPRDTIALSTSGLVDDRKGSMVLSYLHKAIKPNNQLKMLEDAAVIYRIARAPERRVFKIDVGNMPKLKAEQYLNSIMNNFRTKIVYDTNTGALQDDVRNLSMLEDFWLPVRGEGKGTDVSSLPGGQNLGEVQDLKYFKDNLFRSLGIPVGRTSGEGSTFNTGRVAEIDRDEVKFAKFINRLRNRFAMLFTDLLRKQLILKNIITPEDWDINFKNNIYYDFKKDSHFQEYNEAEILTRRMELASSAESLGYFSKKYIQRKFLRLSDEEIDEIEKQKELESKPEESSESSDFISSEPTYSPGVSSRIPEPEIDMPNNQLAPEEPTEAPKEEE